MPQRLYRPYLTGSSDREFIFELRISAVGDAEKPVATRMF